MDTRNKYEDFRIEIHPSEETFWEIALLHRGLEIKVINADKHNISFSRTIRYYMNERLNIPDFFNTG